MAMPPWRRLVVPYLYEVPGSTVAQVIHAPGVLRPSQGEPQVDGGSGKDGMEGKGKESLKKSGVLNKWLEASSYNFSVFSLLGYIFFAGAPMFVWCVSSVSAWSLFAGYSTADW